MQTEPARFDACHRCAQKVLSGQRLPRACDHRIRHPNKCTNCENSGCDCHNTSFATNERLKQHWVDQKKKQGPAPQLPLHQPQHQSAGDAYAAAHSPYAANSPYAAPSPYAAVPPHGAPNAPDSGQEMARKMIETLHSLTARGQVPLTMAPAPTPSPFLPQPPTQPTNFMSSLARAGRDPYATEEAFRRHGYRDADPTASSDGMPRGIKRNRDTPEVAPQETEPRPKRRQTPFPRRSRTAEFKQEQSRDEASSHDASHRPQFTPASVAEVCRFFIRGQCKFGDGCAFAHDERLEDAGIKGEYCRNFAAGKCRAKSRCKYLHDGRTLASELQVDSAEEAAPVTSSTSNVGEPSHIDHQSGEVLTTPMTYNHGLPLDADVKMPTFPLQPDQNQYLRGGLPASSLADPTPSGSLLVQQLLQQIQVLQAQLQHQQNGLGADNGPNSNSVVNAAQTQPQGDQHESLDQLRSRIYQRQTAAMAASAGFGRSGHASSHPRQGSSPALQSALVSQEQLQARAQPVVTEEASTSSNEGRHNDRDIALAIKTEEGDDGSDLPGRSQVDGGTAPN